MSNLVVHAESALAKPLTANSLDSYMAAVSQIDLLSEDEETSLAKRLVDNQDVEAAQRLVMGNLRFVIHIARSYNGYGLQLADLIQEGNIGLMKAVKRFDPNKGVRLVSFAVHWIRAEIHEFVIRNWRLVKVATTKAQRKLFFNLRKQKTTLGWLSAAETQAIAADLGVSETDVKEMESRLHGQDVAMELDHDDENAHKAPAAYLADNGQTPEQTLAVQQTEAFNLSRLRSGLATLDERAKDIVESRWLNEPKATLHDLAGKYKVSAERIRQLEANAIKKLALAFN